MDVSERFAELVAGDEDLLRLDEAALLVAAHARADLDIAAELDLLDRLAARAPEPTLDGVRALLFRDLGFTGNDVDYYDERNSYLDQVLHRRTGIPITLSVVVMEVGRRLGVPLSGVSMPGHFLLRDKVDPDVFVDAFARGALLDRDGARARFMLVQGPGATFDDAFLEPVGKRTIVDRILANLELIASRRADRAMLGWVLRLRTTIPGGDPAATVRYASVLAADGRIGPAADVLDRLADAATDPEAAAAVRAEAARIRALLN